MNTFCTVNCRIFLHRYRLHNRCRDHKAIPIETLNRIKNFFVCVLNFASRLTLLMHRPFSHVNMSSPQGCGVGQCCVVTFSSAPSTQSGSPSHNHLRGMHWARPHDLFSSHVNSVSSSHFRSSTERGGS